MPSIQNTSICAQKAKKIHPFFQQVLKSSTNEHKEFLDLTVLPQSQDKIFDKSLKINGSEETKIEHKELDSKFNENSDCIIIDSYISEQNFHVETLPSISNEQECNQLVGINAFSIMKKKSNSQQTNKFSNSNPIYNCKFYGFLNEFLDEKALISFDLVNEESDFETKLLYKRKEFLFSPFKFNISNKKDLSTICISESDLNQEKHEVPYPKHSDMITDDISQEKYVDKCLEVCEFFSDKNLSNENNNSDCAELEILETTFSSLENTATHLKFDSYANIMLAEWLQTHKKYEEGKVQDSDGEEIYSRESSYSEISLLLTGLSG